LFEAAFPLLLLKQDLGVAQHYPLSAVCPRHLYFDIVLLDLIREQPARLVLELLLKLALRHSKDCDRLLL